MMQKTNEELADWLESYADFYYSADDTKSALMAAAARLRQQSEDSASMDWLEHFPVMILAETNLGATVERDAVVHLNETMTLREALADIRRAAPIDKARKS